MNLLTIVELWITLTLFAKSCVLCAISLLLRCTIGPCNDVACVIADKYDVTMYTKAYFAACRYYGDTPVRARIRRWIERTGKYETITVRYIDGREAVV